MWKLKPQAAEFPEDWEDSEDSEASKKEDTKKEDMKKDTKKEDTKKEDTKKDTKKSFPKAVKFLPDNVMETLRAQGCVRYRSPRKKPLPFAAKAIADVGEAFHFPDEDIHYNPPSHMPTHSGNDVLPYDFEVFFKQKTAYEISACLVGSEMCIRDRF